MSAPGPHEKNPINPAVKHPALNEFPALIEDTGCRIDQEPVVHLISPS